MSPNWKNLSENFRLTPWSLQEHADYVLQEYGKLLSRPDAAQDYVLGYKDAEAKFDQAYANQQEFLDRTTVAVGALPQQLPPLEKLDWDPVVRMKAIIEAHQAVVEAVPPETATVAPVVEPPVPVDAPVAVPVDAPVEPVAPVDAPADIVIPPVSDLPVSDAADVPLV